MQIPSKGRTVLVTLRHAGEVIPYNGSDEHPAIVTATFSDELINARVFVDGIDNPPWETSIPRADLVPKGYDGSTWRWPPRDEG